MKRRRITYIIGCSLCMGIIIMQLINNLPLRDDGNWVIIAHKANAPGVPENSLSGIIKNIAFNAGGIEIDVGMTRDGKLFLMHDETLDRTTNCIGNIMNYNAKQIGELCRLSNGEGVPPLDVALKHLINDYEGLVFVEMKYFGGDDYIRRRIAESIKNVLEDYKHTLSRIIITSFDFDLLEIIRSEIDEISVACEGSYLWAITHNSNILLNIIGQRRDSIRAYLGDLLGVNAYIYTISKPAEMTDVIYKLLRHRSIKGVMVDDVETIMALWKKKMKRVEYLDGRMQEKGVNELFAIF